MTDNKPTQQDNNSPQPIGYVVPMQMNNQEDEIDLLELWNTIWSQRKVIFY